MWISDTKYGISNNMDEDSLAKIYEKATALISEVQWIFSLYTYLFIYLFGDE
mgnify:FL=1